MQKSGFPCETAFFISQKKIKLRAESVKMKDFRLKILNSLRYIIAVSLIFSGIFALIITRDWTTALVSLIIGLIILPAWDHLFQTSIAPKQEFGLPYGIDLKRWRSFWKQKMKNKAAKLQNFKYDHQQVKEQIISFLNEHRKLLKIKDWDQNVRLIENMEKIYGRLLCASFYRKYHKHAKETPEWYAKLHPKYVIPLDIENMIIRPGKIHMNDLSMKKLYRVFKMHFNETANRNSAGSMSDLLHVLSILNHLEEKLNIYGEKLNNRREWEQKLAENRRKIELMLHSVSKE